MMTDNIMSYYLPHFFHLTIVSIGGIFPLGRAFSKERRQTTCSGSNKPSLIEETPRFAEIDQGAFATQNLYSAANYLARQSFIFQGTYMNTIKIFHQFKAHKSYHALPAKASHSILMRKVLLAVLLLIGSSVLAACGGTTTPSGSYVYTDSSQVELLTWKSENTPGSVSGQWRQVSYQLPLSGTSRPSISPVAPLTGTLNGQSLQLSGNALSFTGTLSNRILRMTAIGADGQSTVQDWFEARTQDYDSLVVDFTIHTQLQGKLIALHQAVQFPSDDSNPASLDYAITSAQNYLSMLVTKVDALQRTQSHAQQCDLLGNLSQYYPAGPETFQLPYDPTHSSLSSQLAEVKSLWHQAQYLRLPLVPLKPSWIVTQSTYEGTTLPAQHAYTLLQQAFMRDQQEMTVLQSDYQGIQKTLAPIQKECV